MVRVSRKIRRILIDAGLVTAEEWADARQSGAPVLDVLVQRGTTGESDVLEALGRVAGVPPVDLTRMIPDPSALEALPQETCLEHCVIPVAKNGDILTIAVADPFDVLLLDDLNILSGAKVRPILSLPGTIKKKLEDVFDSARLQVDELLGEVGIDDIEIAKDETDDLAAQAKGDDVPAVKLVNLVLLRALRDKASDIHIEPGEKTTRVRFRIDGRLVEIIAPPKGLLPAVLSRLKILADLDIAIRMTPQDGKFQIRYEGRTIDFRLSTLPVVGGEKAVMRILDQSAVATDLEMLGFEERCLKDIREAVNAAYGMVLITGPTGSGKSTTLYACVKEVSTPEVNVVTVEDPVEYNMEGVNQVPVNPKRGLTFSGALRSILRQDPDIVLVGEIRDTETAEIAVKAALTGHLVLSTLHTNDAVGAVTRLVDMGVDRFMVSSSVLCVAAQRLLRTLCPHCKREMDLPKEELLSIGFTKGDLKDLSLYEPDRVGCPRCHDGYRGRFAVLETLPLTETLKRMVVEGRSVLEIKEEGLSQGMVTLRRAGIENVKRGRTSLAEVLRVTMAD
ncbi:MAG: ATPase, T2SS/T4P/T4SS family [Planctomycetota bacterium]|nr:ATPase, T2SS/T4P/T4SS family [Planctomycetota bacterium]